jgi:hypothetical protein
MEWEYVPGGLGILILLIGRPTLATWLVGGGLVILALTWAVYCDYRNGWKPVAQSGEKDRSE